jgi:hypothetical protein
MNYTDACTVLKLCDDFEKLSKRIYGEYHGKIAIEPQRLTVEKVRNIIKENK